MSFILNILSTALGAFIGIWCVAFVIHNWHVPDFPKFKRIEKPAVKKDSGLEEATNLGYRRL
jgi:hypothetical protein